MVLGGVEGIAQMMDNYALGLAKTEDVRAVFLCRERSFPDHFSKKFSAAVFLTDGRRRVYLRTKLQPSPRGISSDFHIGL